MEHGGCPGGQIRDDVSLLATASLEEPRLEHGRLVIEPLEHRTLRPRHSIRATPPLPPTRDCQREGGASVGIAIDDRDGPPLVDGRASKRDGRGRLPRSAFSRDGDSHEVGLLTLAPATELCECWGHIDVWESRPLSLDDRALLAQLEVPQLEVPQLEVPKFVRMSQVLGGTRAHQGRTQAGPGRHRAKRRPAGIERRRRRPGSPSEARRADIEDRGRRPPLASLARTGKRSDPLASLGRFDVHGQIKFWTMF